MGGGTNKTTASTSVVTAGKENVAGGADSVVIGGHLNSTATGYEIAP